MRNWELQSSKIVVYSCCGVRNFTCVVFNFLYSLFSLKFHKIYQKKIIKSFINVLS